MKILLGRIARWTIPSWPSSRSMSIAGLITVRGYLKQWRIAVLVIFVVAAILAPPDAYSMLLLAGSLTLLYFGGVLLCKLLPRKSSPFPPSQG